MKDLCFTDRLRWCMVAVFLILVTGVFLVASNAIPAAAAPLPVTEAQRPDNSACLACHGQVGQSWKLPSGEVLGISQEAKLFNASVHKNFSCNTCHTNISGYPHPKNSAQTIKEYRLQYKDTCNNCHPALAMELNDSAHTKLRQSGNQDTPYCFDCHNAHQQVSVKKDENGKPSYEEKATIAKTCAKCHNGIYEQYIKSVHGAGVQAKNPDVPACDDCHGIHTVSDARAVEFRLKSPALCATCHTDEKIMSKYGISTQVLNTFVSDFHGTTVTLFEKQSPDQQTNKPVCYDCHGVHDIAKSDDPNKGLQIKQNILVACQKCHPDASLNFPDSWLSHYIPSPDKYPLVYYIRLFYLILIPVVLGGMALIIATDIYRRIRTRGKPVQSAEGDVSHE